LMNFPEEVGLVMFTGGEDVSPELYGHTSPRGMCYNNPRRDDIELQIYKWCLKHDIKMTGICRGSQFLNVMNDGWMIHDVSNHAIGQQHLMSTHNGTLQVNSLHHQMSVLGSDGILIGWAEGISRAYIGDKDELIDFRGKETEAFWYPNTKCAAVQYHPEMMNSQSDGYTWYYNFVHDFVNLTEDEFRAKYAMVAQEKVNTQ